METYGRKTLYSSLEEKDLNATSILEALQSVLELHELNQTDSIYLRDYYIGKQDIRYKTKQTREEINNKTTENWTYAIVEFIKSFLLSEPIQYVQCTDSASDEIVKLNKYMAYENKIKFYEEQIEALLYNIEEKEKTYIYEQVRTIKEKIKDLESR